MELTRLQLQAFKSFGFAIVPGFLHPDRVQALRDSCTAIKTQDSGELSANISVICIRMQLGNVLFWATLLYAGTGWQKRL